MIHPTAIVHPGARLGVGVEVGAYSIIGEHVEIGDGCWIGPHVVIGGYTRVGADNRIFQFASVGEIPQDKKYRGEPTRLEIGDRNTIRAYVHIAHDCYVGNNTIFANNAQLAGHVHVGDFAILGGFTGVHQFVRVGAHCMTAVGSVILQDVPPYVMVAGNTAQPHGINSEGLKRRGFSPEAVRAIKRAYKSLYRSGNTLDEARQAIAADAAAVPELSLLTDFLAVQGRGIVR